MDIIENRYRMISEPELSGKRVSEVYDPKTLIDYSFYLSFVNEKEQKIKVVNRDPDIC